jgi:hypothetical protein
MTADVEAQLRDYVAYVGSLSSPVELDEIRQALIEPPGEWGSLVGTVEAANEPARSEVCEACGSDLPVFDLRHPGESAAPAPQKHRAVVVAAVAAALLLVVGIVVADRNSGNVVTDAAVSPSVSVPAAPRGVADPGASQWPLVFNDEAAFGGDAESAMSGVVAGGPGFVAVGERDGNAAVWTSVDGLAWSRVAHDEAVFGG